MAKHPLAEVFGFPIDNQTPEANRCRDNSLCPFGNKVPNCTKDKANDPLGVCSILDAGEVVITCPVRFREKWIIAEDAARFFFPKGAKWTTLTEVRLKDKFGKSAGNIDVVLCSYNERGKVTDFGALEVQAVYISGNVRNPFEHFMENPAKRSSMDWSTRPNYPNPDYLSSSRKRLAPQLIFKGGVYDPAKENISQLSVPIVCAAWAVHRHPRRNMPPREGRRRNLVACIAGTSECHEAAQKASHSRDNRPLHRALSLAEKVGTYHGGILAPGATFIKHGENGKGLKSRWYAETLAKRITAIGQVRERFTFICGDGIEVMRTYARRKRAVFFIDPPYTAGGSNGKRAGTRLYTHHELDHEWLFASAEKLAGDVLLTYDDAPDVRDLAERHGFSVEAVAMKNTHHAKMNELLIARSLSWLC
ncbi:MAG: hypothetical protein IT434_00525 [Phycisphaerales bacterium]|jgi:hypothetical protein|nr:hypothetical protein [Phycisphaerales bacterium]